MITVFWRPSDIFELKDREAEIMELNVHNQWLKLPLNQTSASSTSLMSCDSKDSKRIFATCRVYIFCDSYSPLILFICAFVQFFWTLLRKWKRPYYSIFSNNCINSSPKKNAIGKIDISRESCWKISQLETLADWWLSESVDPKGPTEVFWWQNMFSKRINESFQNVLRMLKCGTLHLT